MKFTCTHCGKRYASSDVPIAGRVYRIRCHGCGHVIFVNASLAESDAPAGTPAPSQTGRSNPAATTSMSLSDTATPAAFRAPAALLPVPPRKGLQPVHAATTDLSALLFELESTPPPEATHAPPVEASRGSSDTWPVQSGRRGGDAGSPWNEPAGVPFEATPSPRRTPSPKARAAAAPPPDAPAAEARNPFAADAGDPFAAARAAGEAPFGGEGDPFAAARS